MHNVHNLGDVLQDVFKKIGWDKKLKEISAKQAWYTVVGPVFSKSTKKVTFYNNVLFVNVSSSIMRSELMHNRTEIKNKINAIVGENIISDIIVK